MSTFSSIKLLDKNKTVVVAENGKLPELDGSSLKNLPPGTISVGNGLTGNGTVTSPLKLNLANFNIEYDSHINGQSHTIIVEHLGDIEINSNGRLSVNCSDNYEIISSKDVVISSDTCIDIKGSVLLNLNSENTAGGFAVVQENGKLPSSILPEQLLIVNAHNVPFETTSETGDTVVFTKEQLGVSSECEFEIIDSDGYNVSCDSRISRRWTDSGYEITFSGGWPTSSWILKPHGQNGKDGVSIDRNPVMEFTFLDERYGRCVYLDDTTPNVVLADHVYYAKSVRMRIESANESFSGNVVIIPILNGVELEPHVCGTGNWSEISFSYLDGGSATGSLSFKRDTGNTLDTLKDGTVITAIVTVLEVVYER